MFRRIAVPLLLVVFATPLTAQDASSNRASIAVIEGLWSGITGYITQVAEETPESDYAYRPAADVRSIGEMIGHIAGAQYMICAAALGEEPRRESEIEESTTSKAGLVEALKASTDYCAKAYAQSDADLQQTTTLWGREQTKFYALAMNTTHNGEHYGNLVTYLRMQGIVPPSSRR